MCNNAQPTEQAKLRGQAPNCVLVHHKFIQQNPKQTTKKQKKNTKIITHIFLYMN